MTAAPRVSLFVPTWNAGPEFAETLERMQGQRLDRPFETIVIDSGSTDGTVELLRKRNVRLIEIPQTEFDHGLTRNRGVEEAKGEIVVLATQDAMPADESWMQRLVDCFDDPQVAGAYSRQIPRPDANPFIRDRLSTWTASESERRVQQVGGAAELATLHPLERLRRIAFDNVSSAVRRDVARSIPFRACAFGEDIDWAHRVILRGHRLVFEPRSAVVHSHNRSIREEARRVYLDHRNLHRLIGVHTIPRWRDVLWCTVVGSRHLFRVIAAERSLRTAERWAWWACVVPFSFTQNLAQYLGARAARAAAKGRPASAEPAGGLE